MHFNRVILTHVRNRACGQQRRHSLFFFFSGGTGMALGFRRVGANNLC